MPRCHASRPLQGDHKKEEKIQKRTERKKEKERKRENELKNGYLSEVIQARSFKPPMVPSSNDLYCFDMIGVAFAFVQGHTVSVTKYLLSPVSHKVSAGFDMINFYVAVEQCDS